MTFVETDRIENFFSEILRANSAQPPMKGATVRDAKTYGAETYGAEINFIGTRDVERKERTPEKQHLIGIKQIKLFTHQP